MQIKEINSKKQWEDFLFLTEEKTFLHSWNWGEFQKKQGNKIWRIGFFDPKLKGVALIVKIQAKRGTFLFIPHGPVVLKEKKIIFESLKKYLKKLDKVSFARIAFVWEKDSFSSSLKNSPIHIHPEETWELDLTTKDLLGEMRKTTRYLIKQGLKNPDIQIEKSSDLKLFNDLYLKTAKRHNFIPFSYKYLLDQFELFSRDNQISLYLGKYQGEIVSGAIIVFWQNTAFYHHGASLSCKAPVSYILQWKAIEEAIKRNCKKYNFWGIAPDIQNKEDLKKSSHPWAGLTLFKMGFGGYKKEYIKTKDLIFSPQYYLTYFFEKLRKKKRHL
ncbi:MAG: peptidoglycan bridge formation glycyltransferase FemA/FemB family protein [Candidatus Pacebacteria bacterium]|nr:peptidoglycan bridge formation glycyltransferase FemA/FemB family protein [Candidatus Paceibacterota bacterium]